MCAFQLGGIRVKIIRRVFKRRRGVIFANRNLVNRNTIETEKTFRTIILPFVVVVDRRFQIRRLVQTRTSRTDWNVVRVGRGNAN